MPETLLSPSNILLFGRELNDLKINQDKGKDGSLDRHTPFTVPRKGANRELEEQLAATNARIARIYGFSYEGTYYDLPKPVLFLVHGDGEPVTRAAADRGSTNVARAPGEPSLTGVPAADFQFADEIMAWSYDKADHTIRMDVEAGEFEDVLLNMFFDGGGPAVSGARVSGARVSGARVSGARVSGARLSGGRGDSSD
jgi:hypothetical protein